MPTRRGRVLSEEEIELENRRMTLRKKLEGEFKPIFRKHGNQGIMLSEFQKELEEEGVQSSIPSDRLNELLWRADMDGDKYITYREFINLMTGDDEMSHQERLIEIAIFAVYAVELKDSGNPVTATTGVPVYSPLIYNPRKRHEAWRFLSYMFIHQGYLHIVANLIFQMLLGLPLEVVHKYWRVLIIYFCGVVAGSLAHSMTDTHVFLAGASGGCYALIGGHLASVIVNWKEMNYKICDGSVVRFLLSAPVRLSILLLLAGGDTANAVYRRFTESGGTKVGISAHIGGLLAGLLLGIPVLKNIKRLEWEKTLGWVTLAVYLAFVAFAILFNTLYKDYPPIDWD
ncbi:hypothetical protein ScPMuIL_011070 [Solemya velum]